MANVTYRSMVASLGEEVKVGFKVSRCLTGLMLAGIVLLAMFF